MDAISEMGAEGDATYWAEESVGKSEAQRILGRIAHNLWQRWKGRYWVGRMDELLRRRMNHNRSSRGNPYNIPNDFLVWLKNGNPRDIRGFMTEVVRQYLHKQYPKMSDTVIQCVVVAMNNSNFSKNQIRQSRNLGRGQQWYYLTNTHHSDNTIYRIRRRNISADRLSCQMELRFMSGPQHSYNYYHVPLFVFAVMTFIPLSYLTKNGYLAGAWNFFWYSSLTSKIVNVNVPLSPKPTFPFFNKKGFTDGEIEDMRQSRLSKLNSQPIHRKIFHRNGKRIWFTKYMKKPTRFKRPGDRGSTKHPHPKK